MKPLSHLTLNDFLLVPSPNKDKDCSYLVRSSPVPDSNPRITWGTLRRQALRLYALERARTSYVSLTRLFSSHAVLRSPEGLGKGTTISPIGISEYKKYLLLDSTPLGSFGWRQFASQLFLSTPQIVRSLRAGSYHPG